MGVSVLELRRWSRSGTELPSVDLGAPAAGFVDAGGDVVVDHGPSARTARLTRVDVAAGVLAGTLAAAPEVTHFAGIERVVWGEAVLAKDDRGTLPQLVCGAGWPPRSLTSPTPIFVYPRAVRFVGSGSVAWLLSSHTLMLRTTAGAEIATRKLPGLDESQNTDLLAYDGRATLAAASSWNRRVGIVRLVT